jgi:two-component system, NarL family, response regulator LiaR
LNTGAVIRVLFADDHPLAQSGMRNFLDAYDDLELVGAATSGEEAVQLCSQLLPDVVLMDLLMPGMGGVEATRQIKQLHPQVQVIALTSHQDGDMVAQALKAGARSYLLKNVAALDLAQAIRAAMAGRAVLAPEVQDTLVATMSQDGLGSDLSEREREVLQLLAQGLSNQQIAQQLVISPSTTKYHVRNIFEKLGVTSRGEAIALAYQRRLVAQP